MNSTGTSSRSNATPTPIRGGIVAYLGKEDDPSGQCPTESKVEVVEQVSVGMVRRQLPATAQVKFIVLAVTVTITASITDRTDQVLKLVLHTAFGGIAGGRIFRVNAHDQPIPPCFRPGVPVPVRPVCEPRTRLHPDRDRPGHGGMAVGRGELQSELAVQALAAGQGAAAGPVRFDLQTENPRRGGPLR